MGFKDFLRSLFASAPSAPFVPDYGPLEDERLVSLWKERLKLTPQAREALAAEAARRGIDLAAAGRGAVAAQTVEAPATGPVIRAGEPGDDDDDVADEAGDAGADDARPRGTGRDAQTPVIVMPPGAVALRTRGNRALLCLMPVGDPDPAWLRGLAASPEIEFEALVAFNGAQAGFLPTSGVARRLGVPQEAVFVLDPARPAERPLPGVVDAPVPVLPLPVRLDLGFLRLRAIEGRQDAVVARWSDGQDEPGAGVAIGPAVPAADLAALRATGVVGGIAVAAPDLDTFAQAVKGLEQVLLMPQVVGVPDLAGLLSSLGIPTSIATWSPVATGGGPDGAFVRVGQALRAGDGEALRRELAALDPGRIEVLATGLIVGPEGEAVARALVDAACEVHPDAGLVHFQKGLLSYLGGDLDAAAAAYARAAEAPQPEPRAYSNLARVHRRRGALAESVEAARKAVEAMPGDPFSLLSLLDGLLRTGRAEEARALLAARAGILDDAARAAWTRQVEAGAPFPDGRDVFPKLADAAFRYAAEFKAIGRHDESIVLLQRCLRFHPSRLDARLQLGAALLDRGRPDEAVAVFGEGIETAVTVGEAVTLRFNRAACAARQGRLAAAREDLEVCLRLAPAWDEARAQLAVVCAALGDRDEAGRLLAALQASGAAPALLEEVRKRLTMSAE